MDFEVVSALIFQRPKFTEPGRDLQPFRDWKILQVISLLVIYNLF